MKVAVIGGGISGLVSAYTLAENGVNVVLYEKANTLGGHSKTVTFDGVDMDIGVMSFNRATYPNVMDHFESVGVEMERSDMSFSVSLDKGIGCEWGTKNGFSSSFAQQNHLFNPDFYELTTEIVKFNTDALSYLERLENNPSFGRDETLGEFIKSRGYSELFQKAYLIPMCTSRWPCPSEQVMSFSAFSVLSFCRDHNIQLSGGPQCLTIKGRSQSYVTKAKEALEKSGCEIRYSCQINKVYTTDEGCIVQCEDGSKEIYDQCILAVHAPDTVRILGDEATVDERAILGAFKYTNSDLYLHCDKTLMPQNPSAWSACNFLGTSNTKVSLTYWLNAIQNLGETDIPYLVTLNPEEVPKNPLLKWSTGHWIPSVASSKASLELHQIQGKRGIWFCGAYQGYGSHEDGLKAGISAANGILGKTCNLLSNPKPMVPLSLAESSQSVCYDKKLKNSHSVLAAPLDLGA